MCFHLKLNLPFSHFGSYITTKQVIYLFSCHYHYQRGREGLICSFSFVVSSVPKIWLLEPGGLQEVPWWACRWVSFSQTARYSFYPSQIQHQQIKVQSLAANQLPDAGFTFLPYCLYEAHHRRMSQCWRQSVVTVHSPSVCSSCPLLQSSL